MQVEPSDSPGVVALVNAAQDELVRRYGSGDQGPFDLPSFDPPHGSFVVARDEQGHLLGGVGLRPIGDTELSLGEIKRLWVRPDMRRAGVADQLMEFVLARARELGVVRIYLETGDRQPEAQALYRKTGWTPTTDVPRGAHCHESGVWFTKPT
jgi:GNAT superfamily N-acetyltransferase